MNMSIAPLRLARHGILYAAFVSLLAPCFGAQPAITSAASTLGVVDNAFTYQIEASSTPTSYAATGLPAGLSVNPATGLISGTPTESGVFEVGLSATNADGTDTASLALTVGTMGTFVAVADPRYLAFDSNGELAVSGAAVNGYPTITKVAPTGSSRFFALDSFEWLGLAYDPADNLYAARLFGEVTKFTPEGAESTAVPATGTQVHGVALDSDGNVYFAKIDENIVGRATPGGVMSTFASGAAIDRPTGIAFDSFGNLFVANSGNGTVAKVTPDGVATTFASGFDLPWGLAFDSAGTLYVASFGSGTLHKVTPGGVVSTLLSGMPRISGLAFDQSGALYVANNRDGVVLRIGAPPSSAPVITSDATARAAVTQVFSFHVEASGSPASFAAIGLPPGIGINSKTGEIQGIPTVGGAFSVSLSATNAAGTTTSSFTLTVGTISLFTEDPLARSATGLVFDSEGNLFASKLNGEIVKVTPSGSANVYVAGLDGAQDIAIDSHGNLYVSRENGLIHKITPSPLVISVFATGLSGARGLAFDRDDNLYVARLPFSPQSGGLISKITPGGVVSPFLEVPDLVGVLKWLAFDREGNLYATRESSNDPAVIKIAPDGSWNRFAAPFTYPAGKIAFDRDGALYVADYSNRISSQGTIMRVSSTGALGSFSAAGDRVSTDLFNSLAFDSADNLYVGNASGIFRFSFPSPPPVITSPAKAFGTYGVPFSYTITATHGPTEFGAEGLPPGLVVNTTSGEITGTPAQAGCFSVDLAAGNDAGTGFAVLDLWIEKATAKVHLGNLVQHYDGCPKSVSITTCPAGLKVLITYNGRGTPPSAIGDYLVKATVVDPNYAGFACGTLRIVDCTAPVISKLKATPCVLWPANHKLVSVTVSAKVTDNVGVTSFKIIKVTSSEADSGLGHDDVARDIQITGKLTVNLRAERSGKGNGRTYTITVEARDAAGNKTVKTVTVFVPKNQGRG